MGRKRKHTCGDAIYAAMGPQWEARTVRTEVDDSTTQLAAKLEI